MYIRVKNKKRINYPRMIAGIRVSESDYEKLKQGAAATELKFADYVRQMLTKDKVVNSDQLASIRKELNKIGTNINQIAWQANRNGYDDSIYQSFLTELENAKTVLAALAGVK